ncbi:Undecaprenyl-phosphate 4-deoxy-4-formamido-L-arabinose transferase [subsurface metagenome]
MNSEEPSGRKLIVVIPAYNEQEKIEEVVTGIRNINAKVKDKGFELLVYVVNDGSADQTGPLAQKAQADRVIKHKTNLGLGAAVRSGLLAARRDGADIAIKFDADLQHDPNDIIDLIEPILNDEADVVYGNRFGRIQYDMPLVRKIGNIVFTKLMSMLTGWSLKDSQPGIFAVNRDYLDVFNLPGDYNYTQQILLDAYHQGMRFAHVPVAFRKRTTGESFVSMRYPFKVLPQLLLVVIGIKPMKIFLPIGFLFLLIASIVFSVELVLWIVGKSIKPVVHVYAVLGFMFFGLQTLFFGLLAELIIRTNKK